MTPPSPAHSNDNKSVTVRRGRVVSIDIYEVKDDELEILEKGGPAQIQFTFAVFLLTLAFSSFTSLITATFESTEIKTAYIVVCVIGFLGSLYLFIQWNRTKKSVKKVMTDIRNRMDENNPDVQQEDIQQEDSQPDDSDPPAPSSS